MSLLSLGQIAVPVTLCPSLKPRHLVHWSPQGKHRQRQWSVLQWLNNMMSLTAQQILGWGPWVKEESSKSSILMSTASIPVNEIPLFLFAWQRHLIHPRHLFFSSSAPGQELAFSPKILGPQWRSKFLWSLLAPNSKGGSKGGNGSLLSRHLNWTNTWKSQAGPPTRLCSRSLPTFPRGLSEASRRLGLLCGRENRQKFHQR